MQRKYFDGDAEYGSLRTSSWGTQWGQMNQSHALLGLRPGSAAIWGASAPTCLVNSLPSGGLPAYFGAWA
jgi:hypothetical protein